LAIPLSLVARLEEFPRSVVEHASGGQVIQYRDQILSLVPLRDVLEPGSADLDQSSDLVQVVVFNEGERSVGMIVDEIVDVAEEAVKIRKKSDRKGILGSVVVGKRVTDFLDLNEVIRCSQNAWEQSTERDAGGKSVLVADASVFSRGMIRSGLDMAGYVVFEAANLDEAMHRLERQPVDIVVAALDLPPKGSFALLEAMRRRPEWEGIPMLALADTAEQMRARAGQSVDFQDCQVKFDREAMLESVARLAAALASLEPAPAGAGKER
jgi:two-component system chemotaxis sensor kinase CheA